MRSPDGPQKEKAQREAPLRWRVIRDAWERNMDEIASDGRAFDLVVFTGDLGDWGDATDYPRALQFLREVCAGLAVPLDRLFLVPGNHDIARSIHADAWTRLRA